MEAYVEKAKGSSIDPYELLTPREQEVLQLSAEGKTSSQIAERLSVSPRTVEKHRSNLMQKLGLRNRSEVVRFAVSKGIILPDKASS